MAENNRYDTALGVGAGVATYLAMKTFATKPYSCSTKYENPDSSVNPPVTII